MDQGHYNCRDYHISPHFAPTTLTNTSSSPFYRSLFARHESFDELEQRARSPASSKPKFPLLRLPLEIRQQIFRYLLPSTIEHGGPNPLASHARTFPAVKKRGAKGMIIPQAKDSSQTRPSNVVWRRGNIRLLQVCRQLHDECTELLYGSNTFLLFVTYSGITFRYSWLLPSGLAPSRSYRFLELLSCRYLTLIKRLVINVDHVDSYTSMIKFNVSGKGLTHGLRTQVQCLVDALQPPLQEESEVRALHDSGLWLPMPEGRRLANITIRVSNGNAIVDQMKCEIVKEREGLTRVSEDIQEMLKPFGDLRGVRQVALTGAINDNFARDLEEKMCSLKRHDVEATMTRNMRALELAAPPPLCCYGNDL